MLDPLMTLLAAKAKAVGLVAGTALVTSALVGGGAVAMTAVSHEGEVEPAIEQVVELPADDVTAAETTADSGTVGIEPPPADGETDPVEQDVTTDLDQDGLADATGLPVGFVCDDSKNHGQNVSSFAKSNKGPGHGKLVSAIAKSDCGKGAGEEPETEQTEPVETASVETEQAEAPKPAKQPKAEKPAKAANAKKAAKPAKADKPAKQPKAQKATKSGKGGGKG